MSKLTFDPQTSSIVIKAKMESVRGIAYADLVFDTGASLVMLPWKLITGLGIHIDPEKTIKTTTASSVETSPLVTIPKLSVLGYTVRNVECIVRDLPEESYVDGLLGLSFLRHFNISLQFDRGILDLKPL